MAHNIHKTKQYATALSLNPTQSSCRPWPFIACIWTLLQKIVFYWTAFSSIGNQRLGLSSNILIMARSLDYILIAGFNSKFVRNAGFSIVSFPNWPNQPKWIKSPNNQIEEWWRFLLPAHICLCLGCQTSIHKSISGTRFFFKYIFFQYFLFWFKIMCYRLECRSNFTSTTLVKYLTPDQSIPFNYFSDVYVVVNLKSRFLLCTTI